LQKKEILNKVIGNCLVNWLIDYKIN